jgi:hypothetical protein
MSSINSPRVKKLVAEAVEKALEECANQHNLTGQPYERFDYSNLNAAGSPTSMGLSEPSDKCKQFSNVSPVKLKLTFNFYWTQDETDREVPNMFCQPVIDLTQPENENNQ